MTFFFFVLVSATFWLIRSLSEVYQSDIFYPVSYINFPEGKVLISDTPDKLTLKVSTNGFRLLKCKLNLNILPLKFDISSFSPENPGNDTFFIVTESVRSVLTEELDQVNILDITPDTLYFRFSSLMVRRIVVKPMLQEDERLYESQYMQNGEIEVEPDSIIVSGASSLIASLSFVPTEMIHENRLKDTVLINVSIQTVPGVTYSHSKVRVMIPVDQFTEVEETLPVLSVNVPDSLKMVAVPGQVRATYRISLSNYSKVLNNPLMPVIDYMEINAEEHLTRLKVSLSDTPPYISSVRLDPAAVEYLISRR